jgi:DNA-binding NtrC family response regulator
MLNGDAHLSGVEGELRFASDPLTYFQTDRAHDSRVHGAMTSRRILYAGDDMALPGLLKDALKSLDCFVVYSPVTTSRMFIRSEIEYSLLLFDETVEGAELERFARSLSHREQTPVIIVKKSEGLGRLLDTIRRRLGITRAPLSADSWRRSSTRPASPRARARDLRRKKPPSQN